MDYQILLRQLYQDFNARQIDSVLAHMHTDVSWPNGWEGGYVSGQEEVRAYWLRQWEQIDPLVEPVSFDAKPDGQIAIKVRQIIRNMEGEVLSDTLLFHIYTFENGKVRTMTIEH
ncbi:MULTISPECIES: nuclear transport factor 2 family protein [Dyadobacter]|uniref:Nuclear transport factor 2 family protein n=1 Tax=Dyadobacter pollutisoli TaxID=2910158 RepID=A0A9E8SMP0_9BACT|nr:MULTISPECIES: nuclear transport factor 2 family protein [Dyadobacter]WAC12961.1 nuclear transport factor 2 family protein [Dyadobacter pollutisoli]